MQKILVFSDLHIQNDTIIGLDPIVRFNDAFSHALENHPDAQAIVLMGDLTHSGAALEYETLKLLLADAPMPVIYMMGNHDRREAFVQIFPQAALDNAGFVQANFDIGDWHVLTLDTLDGPPYHDRHHSGQLCGDRLSWIKDALEQAKDRPVAIFTHHPFGDIGFPKLDEIKLKNGVDVLGLLKSHPMPVHILSGHVHRTISGQWDGVSYTVLKSTCHQNPLNLNEKQTFKFVNEPGGYGVVLFDGPNLITHTEDCFGA